MDKKIQLIIDEWKQANLEPSLKKELDSMDEKALYDAFGADISFGTAGLRGIIGVGTNRMNIYIVKKTTLGFFNYMVKRYPDALERGVAIAYDCRRKSKEFARASAEVLSSFGMKVYLFSDLRPTPELSFAVRSLKCVGGIMITASHNPPQYNGYKVYDDAGCQLIPEYADMVTKEIENIKDMFNIQGSKNAEIKIIDKEIDDKYLSQVKSIAVNDVKKDNIKIEEIDNYHIYPIADNDTPKLSADRLEYSLSNALFIYKLLN